MHSVSKLGMLKLTINPLRDDEYVRRVVELIQRVPGVVRVRADQPTSQIEIIYRQPVEGLLRLIHEILRMAGGEIKAGQ